VEKEWLERNSRLILKDHTWGFDIMKRAYNIKIHGNFSDRLIDAG
jgi:hypothetical protein